MKYRIKCPYCDKESWVPVDTGLVRGREIVPCDSEIGGCDRYFVAFWHVDVRIDARKIEGQ